jgi:DNA-binding response OmpR family regulator
MNPPSILLIDDEPNLLLGLEVIMRRAGYRVFTASDGKQGMLLAQQNLPDIIVSDVMMPPPNGFDLRKQLSQNPKTAAIPFIFLTARTAQVDKLHGLEAGADDYVTKPFDRQELLARIQAVLRRQSIGEQKGRKEKLD